MKNCLQKKLNNKGFTLLELMIVIGIIVLLSATAIVFFNPAEKQKEQRDALRVSALSQIASAMELYYAEYKRYPTSLSELSSFNLRVSMTDPSGDATCDYQYYINASNSYYEIYSIKESNNFTVPKGQEFINEVNIDEMNLTLNFTSCSAISEITDKKVFKIVGGTSPSTP